MAESLLEYRFDNIETTHTDGSKSISFEGAQVVDGPGNLGDSDYPNAISLGSDAAGSVGIADLDVNKRRFHIRLVFKVESDFEGRQNLVESDHLPFSLYLRSNDSSKIRLIASVKPQAHGWRAAHTRFGASPEPGNWHIADLVYDLDTVGVYLDGNLISVHAFPEGGISFSSGNELYVGSWVDGRRNHFDGSIAALEFHAGIPTELESQLDASRSGAQWHISYKAEQLRPNLSLGSPKEKATYQNDIGAWYQEWNDGAYMYHPGAGSAFEMHGAIYGRYRAMDDAHRLGFLVTDEIDTREGHGRKSVFSKGTIYWSPATSAHEIIGQLHLDYDDLGGPPAWGFPVENPKRVAGNSGTMVRLEHARMYHRDGEPSAHEVHGSILNRYLETGGPSDLGFPVTNETSILDEEDEIGRLSEFERGIIYWSSSTGAHLVRESDIRSEYQNLGGPAGELGLPVSDEQNIPGVSGDGRMVGFQNGTICWYGTSGSNIAVRPFKLHIASLDTDESEGALMGQNDLYLKATITQGGQTLYERRHPRNGDWGGRNVKNVNINIPEVIHPVPDEDVQFTVKVWDSDSGAPFGGDDDHLGTWTTRLRAANAWGLRNNNGILESGSFNNINQIRASVKPEGDFDHLPQTQRFWGVPNQGTNTISESLYAQAFRDVDSEDETLDLDDGLEDIYYNAVVEDIASGGNCFGMSLEAIYARKGFSPFSLPLMDDYTWNEIDEEINVKQCYQVGAAPIWWFVGQFLSGNTHHPKSVFIQTQIAHRLGADPVLCLSQNYDFSGAPHCVLPVGWHQNGDTWTMDILDPNTPGTLQTCTIDASDNTFSYNGTSSYSGGAWTGGRLYYMPFVVLNRTPRTPLREALMLLLGGTILILASDAETESITDVHGNNLDAHGDRATEQLKANRALDGYFVGVPGYDGKGTITGEMLITKGTPAPEVDTGDGTPDTNFVPNVTLENFEVNANLRSIREAIAGTSLSLDLSGRRLHEVAAHPDLRERLEDSLLERIDNAIESHRHGDFLHTVKGKRNGRLRHTVKRGFTQYGVESDIQQGENTTIKGKDLGTADARYTVRSDRDRDLDIVIKQRLGLQGRQSSLKLTVPARQNEDVVLQPKPGLDAIDISVGDREVELPITLTSDKRGQEVQRRFRVPVKGAVRLNLSAAASENLIKSSRIHRIHGPVIETNILEVLES